MQNDQIQSMIGKVFLDIADGLETGSFGSKPRVAITALGSEHGEAAICEGAVQAAQKGIAVTLIGTATHPSIETIHIDCEADAHEKMEELLQTKAVDAAVTMHYPFPIGVSTVGRVITPGRGREMYIATTTGTSSSNRVEAMIKNAIYGTICAKACGNPRPTIGILNVDGARQCESALKQLQANGYDIAFASSERSDGGCVMRGNDLLTGACDVMVTDSLTGNILIKTLSSYTTGGSYESLGFGYGPGIGEGYDRLVMILSRASGAPVVAGAIEYAAQLVRGGVYEVARAEFAAADKAGLKAILAERKKKTAAPAEEAAAVAAPPKEVVTYDISGIEVTDLDDAVMALWKEGIYAESGMGCTGPIVLIAPEKADRAKEILTKGGYIGTA